ncbi:MAG: hypothetical protein KGI37_04855 [Alphaproteobacteria bacterium]|nr:hypothetical protein [Alphaproteobacteria bacterium]
MTRDDLRIFCTALGFTAVVLKGEQTQDQAERARTFARLIEEFCLLSLPDAFEPKAEASSNASTEPTR